MELILAALAGLFCGTTITLGIKELGKKKEAPPQEQVANTQQQVIKQLTDLDLVKELCNREELTIQDRLLCRELTCHIYSRGTDSQTAGSTCEEIININNTISMDSWCNQYQDGALKQDCIELFRIRK